MILGFFIKANHLHHSARLCWIVTIHSPRSKVVWSWDVLITELLIVRWYLGFSSRQIMCIIQHDWAGLSNSFTKVCHQRGSEIRNHNFIQSQHNTQSSALKTHHEHSFFQRCPPGHLALALSGILSLADLCIENPSWFENRTSILPNRWCCVSKRHPSTSHLLRQRYSGGVVQWKWHWAALLHLPRGQAWRSGAIVWRLFVPWNCQRESLLFLCSGVGKK